MRTNLQKRYDRLYYGFERWIFIKFEERNVRRALRGVKFDRDFYAQYKNAVRPYWARFGVKAKLLWVKYNYMLSGSMDPRYLPNNVYAGSILPHFNNHIFVRPLADKNLNNLMYPTVKRPGTVFKFMSGAYRDDDFTPITREEAFARCAGGGPYFIKPTRNSSEGNDIQAFHGTSDEKALAAILDQYGGDDYIVQKAVVQHPELARLNPSSVNTIRVITLLFKGEPRLLSACLRVGAPGSAVDNMGAGGLAFELLPDGTFGPVGCAGQAGKITHFSVAEDERFAGFRVPHYDRVRDTALTLAKTTPHLNYIAWDFAIDEAGDPVLIEFNVHIPGQNQEICGPTFGDLTDEVLAQVFGRQP